LAEDRELLRETEALQDAANRWEAGRRVPEDLLRGVRLQHAKELVASEAGRLRGLDLEFADASSQAAEAEEAREHGQRRRQRLLGAGVGIAVVVAIVAGGLAVLQQGRADAEAEAAAENRARLSTLVQRAVDDPNAQAGLLLALEARRQAPGPETDAVLLGALQLLNAEATAESSTRSLSTACDSPWASWVSSGRSPDPASATGAAVAGLGTVEQIRDGGSVLDADCADSFGDPSSGRRYAVSGESSDRRLWLGPLDGPWELDLRLAGESWVSGQAGFAGERLLLEQPGSVRLVDSVTGTPIGSPIMGLAADPVVLLSPDGRLFAVVSEPSEGGDASAVAIHDAIDGAELKVVEVPGEVVVLYFDQVAGQLLIGTAEGELTAVGLGS
jgi:hypothetical protein